MKSTAPPDTVAVDNDPNNDPNNNHSKSSRAAESATASASATDLLSEHPSLMPNILSYIITTPEDYARLRTVSPGWNKGILPLALKASRNLCNCSRQNSTPFIEKLVNWDEDPLAGKLYDVSYDKKIFEFFEENVHVESMLLVQGDEFDRTIIIDKEEGYPGVAKDTSGKFSKYCQALVDPPSSWEDFKSTASVAYREGMFLSVEDFEESKKQGANFDDCGLTPVILTAKLPKEGAWIIEHNNTSSLSRKVLLAAHIDRNDDDDDDDDEPMVPFVKYLDKTVPMEDEDKFLSTLVGYNVMDHADGESITCQIPTTVRTDDWYDLRDNVLHPTSYFPLQILWSKSQERPIREGVAVCDGMVPPNLHQSLMQQIDAFADQQILDYHPHSKHRVRDIVHPALYSYVKGVSPLVDSTETVPPETFDDDSKKEQDDSTTRTTNADNNKDYWGRAYEASSNYQWLPTYFDIDEDGNCTICDYINNLVPRSKHQDLYTSLERLFSQALPLLESVYSYCRVVKDHHLRMIEYEEMDYVECENRKALLAPIRESPVSLRGRRLQVVTKIVDYELAPGQTYEGVWHVEGMSHEEIVATAIYFCDRDPEIVGGDILFKRAFHKNEATYIHSQYTYIYTQIALECRLPQIENIIDDGLMPLGTVETRPGRFLVFPNSHVHKVTQLEHKTSPTSTTSRSSSNSAKRCSAIKRRRIIVFFLINPEKRIVSTREVPMQQEHVGGFMKRQDALEHRLALMKERKYKKQDWNVREIELCEH